MGLSLLIHSLWLVHDIGLSEQIGEPPNSARTYNSRPLEYTPCSEHVNLTRFTNLDVFWRMLDHEDSNGT